MKANGLHLSAVLEDLMAEEGISKNELARRLDVSKVNVRQFFRADWNPKVETLVRISEAIGHDFGDLVRHLSKKKGGGMK
jgi:transcriptional regulator with XRE-family HTH domain